MIGNVTARGWNNAEVKTLGADVDIWTLQTPIADMEWNFTTRITSEARIQSI